MSLDVAYVLGCVGLDSVKVDKLIDIVQVILLKSIIQLRFREVVQRFLHFVPDPLPLSLSLVFLKPLHELSRLHGKQLFLS